MKVLVAVGSAQTAQECADYVMKFAKKMDAEVYALHVRAPFDPNANEDSLTVLADAGLANEIAVHRLFWKGDVISSILMAAAKEEVDMILLGASESHKSKHWVSSEIMKATNIPVLVMPQHRLGNLEQAA